MNRGDSAAYKTVLVITTDISASPYALDWMGEPRLGGLQMDMGANELQILIIGTGTITLTHPVGSDTLVCHRTSVTISGMYDNPNLAATPISVDLDYYWLYTSDTLNTAIVPDTVQSGTFSGGQLTSNFGLTSIDKRNEGFYSLVVENNTTYAQHFVVSSRQVRIDVFEPSRIPDIRLHIRPVSGMSVHLVSYLDTARYPVGTSHRWIAQAGSPSFAPSTETTVGTINLGSLTTANSTYPYIYELNACATQRSKVYLHTTDRHNRIDTVEICIGPTLPLNSVINLNPILGVLSSNGSIDYPVDPDDAIFNNVQQIANGALMMNVEKAYADASDPGYSHNGDPTVKRFEIIYTGTNFLRKVILVVRQ